MSSAITSAGPDPTPGRLFSLRTGLSLRPTLRGVSVAVVGLVLVVAGPFLGRREAVAIGLFLVAVVVCAWAVMALQVWFSQGPGVHRVVLPEQTQVGEQVLVRFLSVRSGRSRDATRVIQDRLAPSLRRVNDSTASPGDYRLIPDTRGVFAVGPATERLSGPFGLVRGQRTRAGATALRVGPRPIDPGDLQRLLTAGVGDERSLDQFGVQSSPDDLLVREHRPSDPLSRIHWGATARTQQLMVRQEESWQEPRAVVVLDCRSISHRQGTETVEAGDGRSWTTSAQFEQAVRLTAAVQGELMRSGHDVVLMDQGGTELPVDLAAAGLSPSTREATWPDRLPRGTNTVVAVVGEAAVGDLAHLQQRLGSARRMALMFGPTSTAAAWRREGWTVVDVTGAGL